MGWSEESVERLRQMWSQGLTANEIAKKLGVTKNSIVGKVHRLCLTARPSPIKSKDTPEEISGTKGSSSETSCSVGTSANSTAEPRNIKLTELDSHTCRWPIGDPRDDDFCFCGKKVRTGQTYCDEHSQMAYVKALKK